MEARDFFLSQQHRFALRSVGHRTQTFMLANGAHDARVEGIAMQLKCDTTYQRPLRGTDGSRLYPAGYLPAGNGPAQ